MSIDSINNSALSASAYLVNIQNQNQTPTEANPTESAPQEADSFSFSPLALELNKQASEPTVLAESDPDPGPLIDDPEGNP